MSGVNALYFEDNGFLLDILVLGCICVVYVLDNIIVDSIIAILLVDIPALEDIKITAF